MGYGNRIRDARKNAGLSGERLGELCGSVSKQLVSHWEHERNAPDLHQIAAMCQALGVSADFIVLGTQTSAAAARVAHAVDAMAKAAVPDAVKELIPHPGAAGRQVQSTLTRRPTTRRRVR